MLQQIFEPVAPLPIVAGRRRPTGLAAGTLVRTEDGEMPVEFLLAGDRIATADNGFVQLRGTSVLDARDIDMITIARGTTDAGCSAPSKDLHLPACQQVRINDWRAMILHGAETMMTAASSLVDDVAVTRARVARVRLFRLHFDAPQVVIANGVELASAIKRAPRVMPRGAGLLVH